MISIPDHVKAEDTISSHKLGPNLSNGPFHIPKSGSLDLLKLPCRQKTPYLNATAYLGL